MSQSSDEKTKYTIKTSLTMFNGRCYTIRLTDDFMNDRILKIKLNSSTKLVAFAHEPGYEIWSHFGLFPEMPKMVSLGNNVDGMSDFFLTKSVYQKVKYCIDDFEYSQYQCLVDEYKKSQSKLSMDCITPWTQSILDVKNTQNLQSCNDTEFEREFQFTREFFMKASRNKMTACYGNNSVNKVLAFSGPNMHYAPVQKIGSFNSLIIKPYFF